MRMSKDMAKKLEVLLDPEVETALLLLFDSISQEISVREDDEHLDLGQLKLLQGKRLLIKELKQYKQRLMDSVKNG